jgi:hypothetical protein
VHASFDRHTIDGKDFPFVQTWGKIDPKAHASSRIDYSELNGISRRHLNDFWVKKGLPIDQQFIVSLPVPAVPRMEPFL